MQMEFATWFLENHLHNLDKVLWTDEAYFHLDRTVYTKNAFIWGDANPHSCAKKSLDSTKLCLWIGFSSKVIVPPLFKSGAFDGDTYWCSNMWSAFKYSTMWFHT